MKTTTGVVILKRDLFTCVCKMFSLLPNNGHDSLVGIAIFHNYGKGRPSIEMSDSHTV
jgi:hypothetical protein